MNQDYKSVCNFCYNKTYYEDMPHQCERVVNGERCPGELLLIDNSELDPRFTPYYESGEKICVTYEWGEKEIFYVGKSNDWKPIYIALKQKNSSSGSGIIANAVTKIEPLGKFR